MPPAPTKPSVSWPESVPKLLPVSGRIRHYAWGGSRFIPELLGLDLPAGKPCAEYWLGAHPSAPAAVRIDGREFALDGLINRHRRLLLGALAKRGGRQLPFLFKILDVQLPLSIQVHPSAEQARIGFARENRAGIPIDAPQRSFRDANAKPEFLFALSEFWLLYGLLSRAETGLTLAAVRGLEPACESLARGGRQALLEWILTLQGDALADASEAVLAHADRSAERGSNDRTQPWVWLSEWSRRHLEPSPLRHDRGVLFVPIMQRVRLAAGQGIAIEAGEAHAYLHGAGIEVMTSSDNVIRAGLTTKHTDPELLAEHLVVADKGPRVVTPRAVDGLTHYGPGRDEFDLTMVHLGEDERRVLPAGQGPALLFAVDGEVELNGEPGLGRGQAVLVCPGVAPVLSARRPSVLAWTRCGIDAGD